jgi:hypothetical protein
MYIFTYVLGLFFIAGTQFSSARAAMAEPQPTRKISHRSRPHAVPAQERPVS